MIDLLLASASPRRLELLLRAGFAVRAIAAELDESPLPGEEPGALVERLARAKARAVADRAIPEEIIVAGDTVVALSGEILGKPRDDADATRMLRALSGQSHEVLGGWCVLRSGFERSGVARTIVRFRPLEEREITAYIATGEPRDKAGAYGLQGEGGAFVKSVDGSRENVIGLPVEAVRAAIEELLH